MLLFQCFNSFNVLINVLMFCVQSSIEPLYTINHYYYHYYYRVAKLINCCQVGLSVLDINKHVLE